MPIEFINSVALDFTQDGNSPTTSPYARVVSQRSLLATWAAPEGVYPIGEGWVSGDRQLVPCLVDVEEEFAGGTDYKRELRIASLPLPTLDPEDLQWIAANPSPTTVSGYYNTARRFGSPNAQNYLPSLSAPWGIPGDSVGLGFRKFFIQGDIAVPQLIGDLQIYAIDTSTNTKVWERLGFADLPAVYAAATQFRTDEPTEESYPSFALENYTVLGPGAPGTILVHITKREFRPTIAPDWQEHRLVYTVTAALDPESEIEIHISLQGKWADTNYDVTHFTIPASSSEATDLPEESAAWGINFMGPTKGAERSPDKDSGYYRTSDDISDALDEALDDCLTVAGLLYWLGFHVPEISTRIEVIDLTDGATLYTINGETPLRTGEKNISGLGTATRVDYDGDTIDDDFPLHPEPPPPEDLDDPDRLFKYPPPEESMTADYAGGTFDTRDRGPVFLVQTDGPFTFSGTNNPNEYPPGPDPPASTMLGWGTYYLMNSRDTMDYALLGSPPGIVLQSNGAGDFIFGSTYPTATFSVFRCYSAYAEGDDKYTTISPPWPFDPSTLCTDGDVAIFTPPTSSEGPITGQDRYVHPESEWPTQSSECARCHKIRCYDITDAPTQLWEIDARDIAGDDVTLINDNPNPGCGDAISNGVIQDGLFYIAVRGSRGQLLWVVQIRDVHEDPEDPESTILVAAGTIIKEVVLSETSSLTEFLGGDPSQLLFYCASDEFHPTLQVHGPWIYGIAYNKQRWRLLLP
jgi:hypothetical protein